VSQSALADRHDEDEDTLRTGVPLAPTLSRQPKQAKIAIARGALTTCDKQEIDSEDLGMYSDEAIRQMNNEERYHRIKNLLSRRPSSTYKFPVPREYDKNRSFQYGWLELYPWLSYSKVSMVASAYLLFPLQKAAEKPWVSS
jgi:hypothetical protein